MLTLRHVTKRFGAHAVLDDLDLVVPRDGITVVVGKSGAGKSVLSRCCVGLLSADAGEIEALGERVDQMPERALRVLRQRIPYVVQGAALIDWLTVRDNVMVPLVRALRLPPEEAGPRADAALAAVGVGEVGEKLPTEIGPGARKCVSIARALALRPTAVLYDEPTTGLDAHAARLVDEVIRRAADAGTPALVVSHDLASIRLIADRVALLEGGKIAFLGSNEEFFAGRETHAAVRRFFGVEPPER